MGNGWVGELCVLLSGGDITKRDDILWGYTLQECESYIKPCVRQVIFREAVLAYLGVKDESTKKQNQAIGEHCKGKYLKQCEENFGKGLTRVCSTCPD